MAARSLAYYAAGQTDRATLGDTAAKARADLLTPLVKAWCTDIGVEVASLGIQVHGGMGYVEETGAAQHLRDVRISPIYEGTNGIQAADFVMRKIGLEGGAVLRSLLTEIRADGSAALRPLLDHVERLALSLIQAEADERLAASYPLTTMSAALVAGWLMQSQRAALDVLADTDPHFAALKRHAAEYFLAAIVPEASGLVGAAAVGPEMLYAIPDEAFDAA
jgi:3-(methylsulfanyl)propanoyl-CoA dehydrogenase